MTDASYHLYHTHRVLPQDPNPLNAQSQDDVFTFDLTLDPDILPERLPTYRKAIEVVLAALPNPDLKVRPGDPPVPHLPIALWSPERLQDFLLRHLPIVGAYVTQAPGRHKLLTLDDHLKTHLDPTTQEPIEEPPGWRSDKAKAAKPKPEKPPKPPKQQLDLL